MKIYIISYDLKNKNLFNYTSLIEYIKSYGSWAKPMESFWFVKTDKDASTIRDELMSKVHSDDKLIVIDASNVIWASFNLSGEVTNWLKNNT